MFRRYTGYNSSYAAPAPPPAFTPASIPGLWAWYDASNAASVRTGAAGINQAAAGDPVSVWRDISGNGRHIVQAVGAAQPLLSITTDRRIQFSGGQNLTGVDSLVQPFSYAIVWKLDVRATVAMVDCSTTAAAFFFDNGAGSWDLYGGALLPDGAGDTARHVAMIGFDGANSFLDIVALGVTIGNVGAGHFIAVRLGNNAAGTGPMTGHIAEMPIYDHILTGAEITQLLAYEVAKWP